MSETSVYDLQDPTTPTGHHRTPQDPTGHHRTLQDTTGPYTHYTCLHDHHEMCATCCVAFALR
jgi:hypothetical protein